LVDHRSLFEFNPATSSMPLFFFFLSCPRVFLQKQRPAMGISLAQSNIL
jgi:hypothetical protein